MNQKNGDLHEINSSLMSPLDERPNGSKEIMEILLEMSTILKTDLDPETLAICFTLLENGVNSEVLAKVVINLRKQSANTFGSTNSNVK